MTSAESTFSFKLLFGLTLLVLLAHLVVLRTPLRVLDMSLIEAPRAFSTRAIALLPDQMTSTPPPRATTPPRISPTPTARTRPAQPPREPAGKSNASVAQPVPEEIERHVTPPSPQTLASQQLPRAEADVMALPPRPPREYAALAGADRLPGSVRLTYQVQANKFPYQLSAELLWQRAGTAYSARLAFNALGLSRVQTSRGLIGARGLEPIRFSDKYRSEVAAHFVREQGKVTFSANTPDVPLLTGAQDRLSILIQLAGMVASAPTRYPPATTVPIQTIGPRDADTWVFTVGETETLSLPGGDQAALKLVRNPRQEFDQKVEVWLAPALDYLPARVRITEANGDFVDQKWLRSEAVVESLSLSFVVQPRLTLVIARCDATCAVWPFRG